MTNETGSTLVRSEDVEAARQLAEEANSTSDVATLREMLFDQNAGSVVIKAEDGSEVEIQSIGQEKFAELGIKATEEALRSLPPHAESWRTENK